MYLACGKPGSDPKPHPKEKKGYTREPGAWFSALGEARTGRAIGRGSQQHNPASGDREETGCKEAWGSFKLQVIFVLFCFVSFLEPHPPGGALGLFLASLEDHRECQGLNPGRLCMRQALYLLYYCPDAKKKKKKLQVIFFSQG